MATVDESTGSPRQFHHNHRFPRLQPLSPRVPSSIERHFEQYLVDHHRLPKLPSIAKQSGRQSLENGSTTEKDILSYCEQLAPSEFDHEHGPVSRLLNSEQYRRAQTRLIEYRQNSKIPGVSLASANTKLTGGKGTSDRSSINLHGRNEVKLPLKEVLLDPIRTKQFQQTDDFDLVSDDSAASGENDRRQRAKNWIKEHQFFFTEYQ